jgi:AcrR family transcriptional regulator
MATLPLTPTDRVVERTITGVRQRTRMEVEAIIRASRAALAETGWERLNVTTVLRRAHVSTSVFYRNFSSKSELLLMLLEEEITHFAEEIAVAMAAAGSASAKVDAWVSLHLDRAYGERSRARARRFALDGLSLAPEFPSEVAAIRRKLLDPLAQAIIDGAANREFVSAGPAEDALAIWLVTSSLMRDPYVMGDQLVTAENATTFMRTFCGQLLKPPLPAESHPNSS